MFYVSITSLAPHDVVIPHPERINWQHCGLPMLSDTTSSPQQHFLRAVNLWKGPLSTERSPTSTGSIQGWMHRLLVWSSARSCTGAYGSSPSSIGAVWATQSCITCVLPPPPRPRIESQTPTWVLSAETGDFRPSAFPERTGPLEEL
ncbi:hypothetical protein LIA77_05972 [Sarocladium implicatum]|nr:hypothetical protein LIA77_05972 [Sarocladium implicatum]